ncbi:MAG: cytochrome c biogenesis CcdA family protein [Fibrobacterota bacterium]
MEQSLNLALIFIAGLASVLSPCVFPVLPVIMTGGPRDNRFRPLLIVAGLSLAFTAMGVLSSLFGAVIGPLMYKLEKAAGVLIVFFGVFLMADINLFKRLTLFSRLAEGSGGKRSGFLMGLILGLIWIPCVGPMLSSVLTLVAAEKQIAKGIVLLLVYSAGFSLPMLAAGYASQFFRNRLRGLGRHPQIVSIASGLILIVLGLFILFKGIIGFGA